MKFDFNSIQSKKTIDSDPKLHVLAGNVKIGKSTILNDLSAKHNWLILDTQKISGYNNLKGGKIIRVVGLEPPMSSQAIKNYKDDYRLYEELMSSPVKDLKKIRETKVRLDNNKYWETYERKKDLRENEYYIKDLLDFYNEVDANDKLVNECPYDGVIIDLLDAVDTPNDWLEYSAARKWCANNPTFILDKTRISILDLPGISGSRGWLDLRAELINTLSEIIRIFKKMIVVVHFKTTLITEQDKISENKALQSLALRGKSAELLLSECDSFGFMYADGKKRIISYTAKKASTESRALHLHDKEILISEMDNDNKLTTYWDKIYLSYAAENTKKD